LAAWIYAGQHTWLSSDTQASVTASTGPMADQRTLAHRHGAGRSTLRSRTPRTALPTSTRRMHPAPASRNTSSEHGVRGGRRLLLSCCCARATPPPAQCLPGVPIGLWSSWSLLTTRGAVGGVSCGQHASPMSPRQGAYCHRSHRSSRRPAGDRTGTRWQSG